MCSVVSISRKLDLPVDTKVGMYNSMVSSVQMLRSPLALLPPPTATAEALLLDTHELPSNVWLTYFSSGGADIRGRIAAARIAAVMSWLVGDFSTLTEERTKGRVLAPFVCVCVCVCVPGLTGTLCSLQVRAGKQQGRVKEKQGYC
ncbi:hypothetical protein E2C01_049441 [Portunus trituberculatus]|uniref:Uncharacterized protein n=1 Tax=Portunus trituberculatus TaxID=210409 RepID=A0A5B7GDZ2_PORTR|nr:hypothetical protein [Portunus trituberculatus]